MKRLILLGIMIFSLFAVISIVHAIAPEGYPPQTTLTGYDPNYKSPFPYEGSSIYTDPSRAGPHRFTNIDVRVQRPKRIRFTAYMTPPGGTEPYTRGFAPYAPRGNARIFSSMSRSNAVGEVRISTKDIEPSYKDNTVYEAWLFDADSGYRTSMGVFEALFGGVSAFTYRITNYLEGYDYVIITKEPFPDPDPTPGEVVLIGEISPNTPASLYVQPFGETKEMYGYTTSEAMS